jgi:maltose alpha-D-glucosyltransferase/alpha-amylase
VCPTENEAILSFVRHHKGDRPVGTDAPANETVLGVFNLSSRPQASTVQLPMEYAGAQLVDLFGGQGFPKIGDDGKVLVTLGSRDFFWFQVKGDWAHSGAGAVGVGAGERRG